MCGECPVRPGALPRDRERLRPEAPESARPRSGAYSIARARPYYTASPPLFPKESRVSPDTGRDVSERLPESLPGKAGSCRQGSDKGRSAAPAARRLTPHPRPVPCARSAPPPPPRSAWRAISHLRTLSLPREPRRMGAPESLSPGLIARPSPGHVSPPERENIPAGPGRAGGWGGASAFEERGTPGFQNTAAPAAGLRRHAGISKHDVSSAPSAHSALTARPPGPGVAAAPQSPISPSP